MKDIESLQSNRLTTQAFNEHDLNTYKDDRSRKIVKLKAGLTRVNLNRIQNLYSTPKFQLELKSKTQTPISLRGIDLSKIEAHLLSTRSKNVCASNPLAIQPNLNSMMRAMLFNWLLEVVHKFNLKLRTIFLCANIFDRYLLITSIEKRSLQLLGITCLYIASKFEDVHPPKAKDLCFICDNIYTVDQLIALEGSILSTLNFDLIFVSAYDLIDIQITKHAVSDPKVEQLVSFVLKAFLVQGTINLIDSGKLTGFICALVQKFCPGIAIGLFSGGFDMAEFETFELCLKKMVGIARKYRLGALEKSFEGLSSEFLGC